jgi:hypothetical protein
MEAADFSVISNVKNYGHLTREDNDNAIEPFRFYVQQNKHLTLFTKISQLTIFKTKTFPTYFDN